MSPSFHSHRHPMTLFNQSSYASTILPCYWWRIHSFRSTSVLFFYDEAFSASLPSSRIPVLLFFPHPMSAMQDIKRYKYRFMIFHLPYKTRHTFTLMFYIISSVSNSFTFCHLFSHSHTISFSQFTINPTVNHFFRVQSCRKARLLILNCSTV